MAERFDSMLQENANLKKALQQAKSVIERITNDHDTLRQIHQEYKIQQQRMKRENDELHVKTIQLANDKKELEMQFDATIRNLKIAIDLKQREIEEVQAKIIPSFDQDMLRIKIINELEIPHRNQLESKQEELDRMQESIFQFKHQIDILNSKLEIQGKEYERDLKSLKERHQIEVTELMNEIQSTNEKIDDQKDKETIRKQRREIEELKQKFFQKDSESEDLRRERDRCREEKNECLIRFSKQIDSERNEKRIYKTESEKLAIRVRFLDEESKKNKIKYDSILSDNEIQKREKGTLMEEIRKKDDLIHQLQRRITDLEDDHVLQEGKALEKEQKIYNEEREKFLEERNRVIQLQREFDQLKQAYTELNEENKQLRNKIQKDLSQLRQENMVITEERDKLKRAKEILEKDTSDQQKSARQREEELNEMERELENVRRRYREAQQRIQNLENNVDTLQRYKSQLTGPIQLAQTAVGSTLPAPQLGEDSSNLKSQLESEKKKSQKLKEKLKQANDKIMDLLQYKIKFQATQKQGGQPAAHNISVDSKYPITDISNIQQQQNYGNSTSQYPAPPSYGLQNQFNYSYQNNPQQQQQPNQNLYLGALTYEDEKILQEINRTTDGHKYNYY